MTPIHFHAANHMFTDAGGAAPLPAHTDGKLVTTCWFIPWPSRFALIFKGRLWAQTTSPILGLDLIAPKLETPTADRGT